MDVDDLELALKELGSLLGKCEAVLETSSLSPGRTTVMRRRVAALRTALTLVEAEQRRQHPGS